MGSFFLAWLAVALCSLGARDQLLVARLAEHGRSAGALLAVAVPVAVLAAVAMAWAGSQVAAVLPPAARQMLVAFALVAAAAELAMPVRDKAPTEPTRSLFALAVVLLARQFGDAARFLVFALAAAGLPVYAALGGALGGVAALTLAAAMRGELADWPLRSVRRVLAAIVGVAAIWLALGARGLI